MRSAAASGGRAQRMRHGGGEGPERGSRIPEGVAEVAPARPERLPAWLLLLRPVVYALVLAGRLPWLERIYWNPIKRREWAHNVEAIWNKDQQRRAKRRDKASRLARKMPQQAVVRLKTAAKQALGAVGLSRHS